MSIETVSGEWKGTHTYTHFTALDGTFSEAGITYRTHWRGAKSGGERTIELPGCDHNFDLRLKTRSIATEGSQLISLLMI